MSLAEQSSPGAPPALHTNPLSKLNSQPIHKKRPQLQMQRIRLIIRQRALQTAVVDAVSQAPATRLRVLELVHQPDILDQIAADLARNLHHVVLVERCRRGGRRGGRRHDG